MPRIPKPEAELARPRARKGGDQQEVTVGTRRPVTLELEADANWHPIAKMVFESVKTSGQADFYQDSDWAVLFSICEDISYYKTPQVATYQNKKTGEITEYEKPRSGQMLQSVMSNLTSLLLTEGERRRVRLELQEPEKEPVKLASVAQLQYPDLQGEADGAC